MGGHAPVLSREQVAADLCARLTQVSPSRLLVLLGHALDHLAGQGGGEEAATIDLFTGRPPTLAQDEEDETPSGPVRHIKFPKKTPCDVACFAPNGRLFCTGTADGFVELWNPLTCKRTKDFDQEANPILMEEAITALAFSGGKGRTV